MNFIEFNAQLELLLKRKLTTIEYHRLRQARDLFDAIGYDIYKQTKKEPRFSWSYAVGD